MRSKHTIIIVFNNFSYSYENLEKLIGVTSIFHLELTLRILNDK